MNKVSVIHQAFEKFPKMVADVNVGKRTGEEALSYAYLRTQNLKGSWSRKGNPDSSVNVTVLTSLPEIDGQTYGLRSTSMGDMMILGNSTYEVAPVGFDEVFTADV